VCIIYRVQIIAGKLRSEIGGSTDLAAWVPMTEVTSLERAFLIDTALELERTRPPSGHVEPVPVSGLLRH
jgi:8-oxo-dGTP diphosphatase